MPNLQVATISIDGFINSFGMDIGSNIKIPKLPTMGFKDHMNGYLTQYLDNIVPAQYFAIYYRNILYFMSTSPSAEVTRSKFSEGNWSFYQIPNSNIPTIHMDNAIAVPVNKFLWIVGGLKTGIKAGGFQDGMYKIPFILFLS